MWPRAAMHRVCERNGIAAGRQTHIGAACEPYPTKDSRHVKLCGGRTSIYSASCVACCAGLVPACALTTTAGHRGAAACATGSGTRPISIHMRSWGLASADAPWPHLAGAAGWGQRRAWPARHSDMLSVTHDPQRAPGRGARAQGAPRLCQGSREGHRGRLHQGSLLACCGTN